MNTEKLELFKKYLEKRGYAGHLVGANDTVTFWGRKYFKIDVNSPNKEVVIQTFVLMSEKSRNSRKRYPLWERYHQCPQGTDVEVNPAVFIATYNEKGYWEICSASRTDELKDEKYIVDYEAANRRFEERIGEAVKITRTFRRIKLISWGIGFLLSAMTIAHIVQCIIIEGAIQLSNSIVAMAGLIAVLIIFPLVLPYVKSISVNGIDLNL